MKKLFILLLLVCAVAVSYPALAEEGGKPDAASRPSVLDDIDALFLLQDATARGREDAAVLQKSLLVGIGETLMAVAGDDSRRLAPHVTAYVLSGGDPRTAEKLAAATDLDPMQRQLLEGAGRFMQGERDEATKHFSGIDPMALPARLAGRVALAQALLATEPSVRQNAYAVAMSAMPGTLIEESALRRSALAYAEKMQEQPLWKRLERYQRRFPQSVFARTFWEDIMDLIVDWAAKGPSPSLARLDVILAAIATPERRSTYLHLARKSAAVSNEMLVTYAAGRARRLAVEGSQEDQVAKLYLALFAIASEHAPRALRDLRSIPPGVLDRREQALRDAALSVAEQIDEPLGEGPRELADSLEKEALRTRVESLLKEIDALLAELGS